MAVRTHRYERAILDPSDENVVCVQSGGLRAVDEKRLMPANDHSSVRVPLAAVRSERDPVPFDDEVREGGILHPLGLEDEARAEGAPFLRLHLGATERRRNLAANRTGRWWEPRRTGDRKAQNGGGPPASPSEPRVGRDEFDGREPLSGISCSRRVACSSACARMRSGIGALSLAAGARRESDGKEKGETRRAMKQSSHAPASSGDWRFDWRNRRQRP
jgi:hypothetical protein